MGMIQEFHQADAERRAEVKAMLGDLAQGSAQRWDAVWGGAARRKV